MPSPNDQKISYDVPILLIESDPLDLSDMTELLRELQFDNIRVAKNGFEALDLDEGNCFSLIFISGATDKVSPSKLIAAFRAGQSNGETPIVYTYRRKEKFRFEDAQKAGATTSLAKPSNVTDIRRVIESQLKGYVVTKSEQKKRSEEVIEPMIQAVEEGKRMIQEGEFSGAEEAFEKAVLDLFCGMIEVHLYKGNLKVTQHILDSAQGLGFKVRERLESRESAFLNRGNMYVREESFGRAKDEFHAAIALNPGSLAGHVGLGEALAGLGERAEAVEVLERGLEACEGSTDTNSYGRLCALARRINQYELAHLAIDRAIEVDPVKAVSHYNKGLVFLAQKEFESAMGSLNRAIAINPMFYEARITLRKIETWLAGAKRAKSKVGR